MASRIKKAVIEESGYITVYHSDDSESMLELFYPDQYTVMLDDGVNLSVEGYSEVDKGKIYEELKRYAIVELNKPHLKPIKATDKTQLLYDAFSVLSHGTCDEQQDVIKRLTAYFQGSDCSKLQANFDKRYPQEDE